MSILSKKSLPKTAIAMLLLICVSSASFAYESSENNNKNEHKNEKAENCYVGINLGQIVPINNLLIA